jgi:hypothetical protein
MFRPLFVSLFSYPSKFIDAHFKKFFSKFHVSTSDILPLTENESEYFRMRAQLRAISTTKQSLVIESAAAANVSTDKDRAVALVADATATAVKQNQWASRLILHYMHEKRLEAYKRDIHQIWNEIFAGPLALDVRVIVGHRNSRNLQRELVRKRPHPSLLGTIQNKVNTETSSTLLQD